MSFLGYKKNEILEYNEKRCCGLWFLIIGMVIIIAAVFGGDKKINPAIFTIGYVLGFYISIINKQVVSKLSFGVLSKFQNNIANFSIVILFLLMFFLAGPFFPSQNWRMIWLGTFLAVGLHFFLFYFVHGRSMIVIAFLCTANAFLGMFLTVVPFMVFALIDGLIKIGFGIYLLFFSKPTTNKIKFYQSNI